VTAYWPWGVKPLALRFLGAIFLTITLGCWSVLKEDLWQRSKILVLVGAVFYILTGTISFYEATMVLESLTVWVWTLYFLGGGIGLFIILWKYGWYRTKGDFLDEPGASMTARIFFLIQTIVVGIFGMMLLLLPNVGQTQFWPWHVATLATLQVFGSLFIATCFATGWASLQKDKGRMRVLLPLDASFPTLALLTVAMGWNTVTSESPGWLVTIVWLGLYLFVAIGSTVLYWNLRK
jgi:hypothetical protein